VIDKRSYSELLHEESKKHGWGLILIAREQLKRWITQVKPRKLLDIGCHNRLLEQTVREWYSKVETFGLDITVYEVKPSVLASGDHLPFKSCTFDFVTLIETLEHIPDYVSALREVRRILRPGGVVFIQSVCCLSQHAFEGDESHFHVLHPNCLARLLKLLGMEAVESGMIHLTFYLVARKAT